MQTEQAAKLDEFIEASKGKGASDEFLGALLARRGWAADDVYAALGRYWETATGVSVPDHAGAGESSREAFLYLLSFSTLATWATALGSIIYAFIDHWLPDPVARVPFDLRTTVTWQMAAVAVAFPIYLLVMRFIVREAAEHPERMQSGVRKWLTYIALLLTAGTMICDLIWFLDYFLMGELTLRFVLKAATVLLIAGGIFTYYLASLRFASTASAKPQSRNLIFGGASSIAVIATFCAGLSVAGTPSQQRQFEADNKRVQNLRELSWAIQTYYRLSSNSGGRAHLPATPDELVQTHRIVRSMLIDPETNIPYEYVPRANGSNYQLCATFAASSSERTNSAYESPFWHHDSGRTCFALDASQAVPQ